MKKETRKNIIKVRNYFVRTLIDKIIAILLIIGSIWSGIYAGFGEVLVIGVLIGFVWFILPRSLIFD